VAATLAFATAALFSNPVLAQIDWPTRTVNVIIGASPGGDTGSAREKITAPLGNRIQVAGIAYGAIQDYHTSGETVVLG